MNVIGLVVCIHGLLHILRTFMNEVCARIAVFECVQYRKHSILQWNKIRHILICRSFHVMTFTMCHMLCSTLGEFSRSLNSVNVYVPDLQHCYRWCVTSHCHMDVSLCYLIWLQCISRHVIIVGTKFQKNWTVSGRHVPSWRWIRLIRGSFD